MQNWKEGGKRKSSGHLEGNLRGNLHSVHGVKNRNEICHQKQSQIRLVYLSAEKEDL